MISTGLRPRPGSTSTRSSSSAATIRARARDPSRPPVLLAHGWPSSFLEMLPLVDLLDVDVVVPSLPGYLLSELLEDP